MLQQSGTSASLLEEEQPLEPEQVAQVVLEALQDDRLLILSHPEVLDYYRRAETTDRWLSAMNRLRQRLVPSTEGRS